MNISSPCPTSRQVLLASVVLTFSLLVSGCTKSDIDAIREYNRQVVADHNSQYGDDDSYGGDSDGGNGGGGGGYN